jgi:hypothetical protein
MDHRIRARIDAARSRPASIAQPSKMFTPTLREEVQHMLRERTRGRCEMARSYPIWWACWRAQCRLAYHPAAVKGGPGLWAA